MKANADNSLDKLTHKILKEASLESPSMNFTDAVMSQVSAIESSSVTVYKPLISKRMWFILSIAVIGLMAFFVFNPQTEGVSWFSSIDLNVITNNKVTNALSSFTMSKSMMYALVFLGVMFCIQVPLLKHNLDKRFEV